MRLLLFVRDMVYWWTLQCRLMVGFDDLKALLQPNVSVTLQHTNFFFLVGIFIEKISVHIRGWTSHRVKCVCSPAGSWIFSRVSERMLHIHSLVFSTHIYSINSGAMDETSLQQISAQACELDVCEQVCILLQYNSVTLEILSISIVPCLFRFHHLLNYKKQKSEYVTKMGVFIAPLCFLLWRMVMRLQVTYAVCIRRCCFIFRDLSIN